MKATNALDVMQGDWIASALSDSQLEVRSHHFYRPSSGSRDELKKVEIPGAELDV